eukprot:COSAG05_NODE_1644_length_4351_cov_343.181091_3_plen_196_part_00
MERLRGAAARRERRREAELLADPNLIIFHRGLGACTSRQRDTHASDSCPQPLCVLPLCLSASLCVGLRLSASVCLSVSHSVAPPLPAESFNTHTHARTHVRLPQPPTRLHSCASWGGGCRCAPASDGRPGSSAPTRTLSTSSARPGRSSRCPPPPYNYPGCPYRAYGASQSNACTHPPTHPSFLKTLRMHDCDLT